MLNVRLLPRFGLGLVLILGFAMNLAACGGETGEDEDGADDCTADQSARADTILALTPDEAAGQTVFSSTCGNASCHGTDGSSGTAPDLADEVPELSEDGLACVLLAGTGTMPSQANLSDQELADVIAYVQATF